jgi:glycerol-3-phosphate acyltransferase PlsX
MRIALDAVGGDHGISEVVKGAVKAARNYGCTVVLVGPHEEIAAELSRYNIKRLNLPIVHAPDMIHMHEHPAQAVRRKPDSSHMVGLRLVRDGKADAFVSAGHSGASMAGALFVLGRLPGIERPAIAGIMPTLHRPVLILDVGATTDCKPEYLLQFAQMGSVYAEQALGILNPRVALLANGEEPNKGNRLVQEAHLLLLQSKLNFVGNAEPKDLLVNGICDVLITDGFVGNLMIKMTEGVVSYATRKIVSEFKRNPLERLVMGILPITALTLLFSSARRRVLAGGVLGGAGLVGAVLFPLMRLRRVTDYRAYGGAPLLGVEGVIIISHGRSDAFAIMNAIRLAKDMVETGTISSMADVVARRILVSNIKGVVQIQEKKAP